MKNIINASLDYLNKRGYAASVIDIKRAYWRHAKQRNGFNVGRDNQAYTIGEYLILNRKAKIAYKFQPVATVLFLLLFSSCVSYENLREESCNGYRMALSSPFFEVATSMTKGEIYVLTDLPLARNRAHYITHHDTCTPVQVSRIERQGDEFKMTFVLNEDQFDCYRINLNESDITYCTRYRQTR